MKLSTLQPFFLFILALTLGATAIAMPPLNPKSPGTAASREAAPDLTGIGITEKLGTFINSGIEFSTETGLKVQFSEFFKKGKPVILSFGYYDCPMLCGLVFNGLTAGLKDLSFKAGSDFEWVNVSIDHREKPELALKKKQAFAASSGLTVDPSGWHFLTGTEENIKKLASQVGYGYRYDEKEKEYLHGAGIFVLTSDSKISRILYGIDYPAKTLKLSLVEASAGKVGTIIDRIVLFCYQYSPHTRKYSLVAMRLIQAGSAGTVLVFGGYLLMFWCRQIRRGSKEMGKGSDPHV